MILPLVVIIIVLLAAIVGTYLWKSWTAEEGTVSQVSPVATEQVAATPEFEYIDDEEFMNQFCPELDIYNNPSNYDKCWLNISTSSRRPIYCSNIAVQSGEVSVDACYKAIAILFEDVNFCGFISQQFGDVSYHSCMTELAKHTGNPYLCLRLTGDEEEGGNYTRWKCLAQLNLTKESLKEIYGVELE
jgi:hypothetical protein